MQERILEFTKLLNVLEFSNIEGTNHTKFKNKCEKNCYIKFTD